MQTRAWSLALALVTAAACGGGESTDAKMEIACGATWATNPATPGTCDLACEEMVAAADPSCTTGVVAGPDGEYVCPATFEVDGERGCCLDTGRESQVAGGGEPGRQRRVFFLSCAD